MNRVRLLRIGRVALIAWLATCGKDASAPNEPTVPIMPKSEVVHFAISEPVPGVANENVLGSSISRSSGGTSYVSFAVGEQPGWQSIRLSNETSGMSDATQYAIVDGGLDAVGIAASVGDTIRLEVHESNGLMVSMKTAVPAKRAPRVVRINPGKGRADVALNSKILVVFSEPMDSASLTPATVRLLNGTQVVHGVFEMLENSLSVEFTPAQPLSPNTTYTLVVTRDVRDRGGDSLEEEASAEFRTADGAVEDPPAQGSQLWIEAPTSDLAIGDVVQLTAVLKAPNGTLTSGVPAAWETTNPLVTLVSHTGRVDAVGTGTATIQAHASGQSATFVISVRPPAPGSPAGSGSIKGVLLDAETRKSLNASNVALSLRMIAWSTVSATAVFPSAYDADDGTFSFTDLPAGTWTISIAAVHAYKAVFWGLDLYPDTTLTATVTAGDTTVLAQTLLTPLSPKLIVSVSTCPWALPDPPSIHDWGECDSGYWGGAALEFEVVGVPGTPTETFRYSGRIGKTTSEWGALWDKNGWSANVENVPVGEYDITAVSVSPIMGSVQWLPVPWQTRSRRVSVTHGVALVEYWYWHK